MKLARLLFGALILLTLSGFQHALHGAVFAADFPDAGHGLRDRGPAGGSAVGGVHALAGAVDDGGGSGKRGRGDLGKRGRGWGDVAGGADLGESDFELALDLGGFPEIEGELGRGEPPVVFSLPFQVKFVRAAGEMAAGDSSVRVFLEHGGDAGRALLIEAGRLLGLRDSADDEEQGGDKESFHAGILARVLAFGKIGKRRGSVTRHHRNDKDVATCATSEPQRKD